MYKTKDVCDSLSTMFQGELQRLRKQGHPLAVKWEGTFYPFTWVQNNLSFLTQPVVGLGSNFGLHLACNLEAMKTAASDEMCATILRNPHAVTLQPDVWCVPRKYSLQYPIIIKHGTEDLCTVQKGDSIFDIHARTPIHQMPESHLVEYMYGALKKLQLLDLGEGYVFSVSPTLAYALAKASGDSLRLWDLSAVQNCSLAAMYMSYAYRFLNEGKEEAQLVDVKKEDIGIVFGKVN